MNPKEPTSSISREVNPKSKLIETLFSKFAAFYGHIWRSQFKSEGFLEYAKKEWQDGLNRFSENTINKAIIQCRDFYELPPSLPQMIACCREIKKRTQFYVVKKNHVPAKQEVVVTHLNKCKEILTRK
ncbi:TPA: Vir protein [Legionella pneumophila]|nr:Vir protein [Legionella pneumophila]HAU1150832.1 Vir protein [Legionella pneumophila]